MVGSADAFLDQRLALGRVAFPAGGFGQGNRAVGDRSQKSIVAVEKPGDGEFRHAIQFFMSRQS